MKTALCIAKSQPLLVAAAPVRVHSAQRMAPIMSAAHQASAAELTAAKAAVRLASKLCRDVQLQLTVSEKVEKSDESPVTVADYGAQALVAWSLQQGTGRPVTMVAEEDSADLRAPEGQAMLQRITSLVNKTIQSEFSAESVTEEDVLRLIDMGGSAGGAQGDHWVLDPIDGTRGFVGMRQYAVCLGLIREGEVVLGVLGCPNLPLAAVDEETGGTEAAARSKSDGVGCLFAARRGDGATVSPLWEEAAEARPIVVNDSADFSEARFMESFESRHSDHTYTATLANALGVVLPPLRMDSQVKYGILSRGDASVFMRFPPASYREKIWDHCAGFCIVEEAGGKVTDAAGRRLDFSQGRWLALERGIIAAPPRLHAALVAAANPQQ